MKAFPGQRGRRSGHDAITSDEFDRGEAGPNHVEAFLRAHPDEAFALHEIEAALIGPDVNRRLHLDRFIADLIVLAPSSAENGGSSVETSAEHHIPLAHGPAGGVTRTILTLRRRPVPHDGTRDSRRVRRRRRFRRGRGVPSPTSGTSTTTPGCGRPRPGASRPSNSGRACACSTPARGSGSTPAGSPNGSGRAGACSGSMRAVRWSRGLSGSGRHLPLSFALSDAAALDLPDGLMDAVHCERLLQVHPAPAKVVAEGFVRVLRPGGRLVAVEPDWGTLALDPGEPDVVRRLAVQCAAGFPDGWTGRKLWRYLTSQARGGPGRTHDGRSPRPLNRVEGHEHRAVPGRSGRRRDNQSGRASPALLRGTAKRADRAGTFLFAMTTFRAVGQRPMVP